MTTENEHSMGAEFETLDADTKAAIRSLVDKVRRTGYAEGEPFRAGDIYAYPHRAGGVAWGVNGAPHGFCIARGISKTQN